MKLVLQDIVDEVSKAAGLAPPDAQVVARRILSCLEEGLFQGETIEIRDFGVFKTRRVEGRVGRDLKRGTAIALPAHWKIKFKPGKRLKPVPVGGKQLSLV
ncbi:MAG TPA: HU family DNA-binding protein [bacterium]|nr:HU family DNA-binding protein [bacterium]